ncbi:hypothetical protein RIF29_04681 [Crotalaria pallida]|uniref:Uncharacterized protein n=1 Tax=Crotalaria pallida TaxID=3830 RepID=A0AAN9J286_CROPI
MRTWREFCIDLGDLIELEPSPLKHQISDEKTKESSDGGRTKSQREQSQKALNEEEEEVSTNNRSQFHSHQTKSQLLRIQEASELWMVGQQLGVVGQGNDTEIIQRMKTMEDKDIEEQRRRRRARDVDQ